MLTVVTGPPAGGKSTYVRAHAKPGDVVIDYDLIAQALSAGAVSEAVTKVAQRARYAAIDEAMRLKEGAGVWLIHSAPSATHRARYKRVGARLVVVDPGQDVVMQRIAEQRKPGMQAVATRWYRYHAQHSAPRTGRQASREW